MWCVQAAAPANRAPGTDVTGTTEVGPVARLAASGERAPRCCFWKAEPAVSGPVSVAHMAPTPGFSGGCQRQRGAPHVWVLESSLPSLEMILGQLLPGKEGRWPASPTRMGADTELVSWGLHMLGEVPAGAHQVAWAEASTPEVSWQVSATAIGLSGPSEVAEAPRGLVRQQSGVARG